MVPLLAGDLLNTLTGQSGAVYSVAISTDGNMVASGSHDNTVRLWNPHTGMSMASHCEPSQRMGGRGWGGGGTSPVGSSPLSSPGTSCHVSFGWHGEWGADWGREASVKGGPLYSDGRLLQAPLCDGVAQGFHRHRHMEDFHWNLSHFHKWMASLLSPAICIGIVSPLPPLCDFLTCRQTLFVTDHDLVGTC